MKQKIKAIIEERDTIFVKHFCTMGTHITDDGAIKSGVCRPISVTEVLNLLHHYDEDMIEAIESTGE